MILRYILKPGPVDPFFADMVTLEVGMMHFAQYLGLKCATTGLIYAVDGTPVLLSQRFDRSAEFGKIHCEDFAQALGVDPGNKYDGGTLERAADLVGSLKSPEPMGTEGKRSFAQVCLYNYLMGNADNHLKNFSVAHLERSGKLVSVLAPFYDLVPARLFPSGDKEQTGLSLAGKKSRFKIKHFVELTRRLGLGDDVVPAFIDHFNKSRPMLKIIMDTLLLPKPRVEELEEYAAARLADLT
jgi:serine/threonine-protein kinase HipA